MEIEGDAFGKIYEYFLGNLALKEDQKDDVFYTPTHMKLEDISHRRRWMGLFDIFKSATSKYSSTIEDEYFYGHVANELANGDKSPGLYAKAFADSQGDMARADALYIALRAKMLREERDAVVETAQRIALDAKRERKQLEAKREQKSKTFCATSPGNVYLDAAASSKAPSYTPKDNMDWWVRAAEKGNAGAQYSLARAYAKGDGQPIDLDKAEYWYERAATQGHGLAKDELAVLRQYRPRRRST